jgi:hypothetical protein
VVQAVVVVVLVVQCINPAVHGPPELQVHQIPVAAVVVAIHVHYPVDMHKPVDPVLLLYLISAQHKKEQAVQ